MQTPITTITGLLLALALASCDPSTTTPKTEKATTDPNPNADATPDTPSTSTPSGTTAAETGGNKVALPSGLEYVVLKEGQGESPKLGSSVLIHCVGRLPGGHEFWNTRTAGVPQRETLNYDQLIPGVVEALLNMKPGERREVHIPSALAYGNEGYPHKVPPRADLDMDLELVRVVEP